MRNQRAYSAGVQSWAFRGCRSSYALGCELESGSLSHFPLDPPPSDRIPHPAGISISYAGLNVQKYLTATAMLVLNNSCKFAVIAFGICVWGEAHSFQAHHDHLHSSITQHGSDGAGESL